MRKLLLPVFVVFIALIFSVSCGKPKDDAGPGDTFKNFKTALTNRDFATVWDMLSGPSQNKFNKDFFETAKTEINSMPAEKKKEVHPILGMTNEEIAGMKTKDFFVLIMGKTEAGNEFTGKANCEVELVNVKGNTAKLKLKDLNDEVTMIKEGNTWKVEL